MQLIIKFHPSTKALKTPIKLHLYSSTLKSPQQKKFVNFKAKLGKTEQEGAFSRVVVCLTRSLHVFQRFQCKLQWCCAPVAKGRLSLGRCTFHWVATCFPRRRKNGLEPPPSPPSFQIGHHILQQMRLVEKLFTPSLYC